MKKILLLFFLVSLITQAFPNEKVFVMNINRNQALTNNPNVKIYLRLLKNHEQVVSMKIGFTGSLEDAEWEKFHTEKDLTLKDGDGDYTIFAMVKDKAGNESFVESASINLDTTPPQNVSLIIDNSRPYSNSKIGNVNLSLEAEGATEMEIKSDNNFSKHANWEPYKSSRGFTLIKGDGVKNVYVRFKDEAGNISEVATASIIVDSTVPSGRIVINDNEELTISRVVYLSIWADDDVQEIRIVGPHSRVVPFEPGQRGAPMFQQWHLDTLDGKKYIKVFFKDKAGNFSKEPVSDYIMLDTKSPEKPRMSIDNSAKYSTNQSGKVKVRVVTRETENEGYTMMISNNSEFEGAEQIPLAPLTDWVLENDSDGEKTVYVKVFDKGGNFSEMSSDDIILDRVPPEPHKLVVNSGETFTQSKTVKLEIEATDAIKMEISNTSDFSGVVEWEDYSTLVEAWPLVKPGKNTIYVKFKDEAENESEVISGEVIFDATPPNGSFLINNGNNFTTDENILLEISADKDAKEMQVSNSPDFSNSDWVVVESNYPWTLDGADGEKLVGIRFKDEAGNISAVEVDKIILDRTPPEKGKILINKGAEYATKNRVSIMIQAKGANGMQLSENPEFTDAAWIEYKTYKEIYLSIGEGERVVYARFKDAAGNISETVSDNILLDVKAPDIKSFTINDGAEFVNDRDKRVTLKFQVEGASEMKIAFNPNLTGANWQPYKQQIDNFILPGEDGDKVVYVQFKDQAGNTSLRKSARVILKRAL